jgi:hypothetical protein
MAIAEVGPSPGNTPTKVPSKEPTTMMNKLKGVNTAPNPLSKYMIESKYEIPLFKMIILA